MSAQNRDHVTKRRFLELYTSLQEARKSTPLPRELTTDVLGIDVGTVADLLGEIAKALENVDNDTPAVCPKDTGNLGTLRKVGSYASKALRFACQRLGFPWGADLSIRSHKNQPPTIHVMWKPPEGLAAQAGRSTHSIKHVIWCKAPYWSEFIDLLVRGARIEAEFLGCGFHCVVVDTAESLGDKIDNCIKTLAPSGKPRYSKYVAIVSLVDPAVTAIDRPKCRTITGGYPESTMCQDNLTIGTLLADALWDSLKRSGSEDKCVVTLAPDPKKAVRGHKPEDGPVGRRIHGFDVRFRDHRRVDSSVVSRTETVYLDFGSPGHAHEVCTDVPTKLMSLKGDIGIFSPTGEPAALLLSAIHANEHLRARVKMVAADITPTLVGMLGESAYPLEAICGIDPIEYGRMYVRMACNLTSRPDPVPPIIITRNTMTRHKLRLTSDIVGLEDQLRQL